MVESMAALIPDWAAEIAQHLMISFTIDFTRYLLGAGGVFLIVWVLFNGYFQRHKIRKKTPRPRQMIREFGHSAVSAFVYGIVGMITFYGVEAGYIEFYADIGKYGWGYWVFNLLFMIVLHDAYFYWTHRLMHLPRVIKRTHALHHRSINPTPWTAYAFDPIEAATHALFVPLYLLVFPMHGLVMFLFLAHMIIRNAVGHSGYELFPRSWAVHPILGAITHVTHHDMHHANGQHNFGLYFTWWDRLMGTEHPDYLARVTGDKNAVRNGLIDNLGVRKNA